MTRLNVYARKDEDDYTEPELAGWFDASKADHWDDSDYNGNGSHGTGRGEGIWRTTQGRWVKETWSRWQGEPGHACTFIDAEEAREWLLRNDEEEAVAKYFDEIEEERGPGRPKVGEQIGFTIPAEDLTAVDAIAKRRNLTRSAVLRNAVTSYIAGAEAISHLETGEQS